MQKVCRKKFRAGSDLRKFPARYASAIDNSVSLFARHQVGPCNIHSSNGRRGEPCPIVRSEPCLPLPSQSISVEGFRNA